jgi:hypothetical protein
MKARFKAIISKDNWIANWIDVSNSPYPLIDAEQHARYLLRRLPETTHVEYTDGFSSVKRIMER